MTLDEYPEPFKGTIRTSFIVSRPQIWSRSAMAIHLHHMSSASSTSAFLSLSSPVSHSTSRTHTTVMSTPQRCALDTSTACSTVPTSPPPRTLLFTSTFTMAFKVICDDTYSNGSWCIVDQGMFALREINQMEWEMCSYLEWQLNVEPSVLVELESMVQRDFKGPGPYPAHYTLPAPSSGPLTHPKPSTSNMPTAIPSFGSSAPPSPPSVTFTVPPEKLLRRLLVESYPTPKDIPQLPTPPSSYSNVPSPENSMSPVPPPNYEGDTEKIVSSTGSNMLHISSNSISPPCHHIHARKSSSPTPVHMKTQISLDTKHTSPKRTPMLISTPQSS